MASSSTRSTRTSGRAHYKLTKTITGPDGKTRVETVELKDDDAVKFMRELRLEKEDVPDLDRFGYRPLENTLTFDLNADKSNHHQKKSQPIAQDIDKFTKESLQIHNDLRRKHGAASLTLNHDLSKLAQQWAEHLANIRGLVHSKTKYQNKNVGENLRSQSWPMTGKDMSEAWYSEQEKYNYNGDYQYGTGHFTQLVWNGTKEVGFGRATDGNMWYGVAAYFPAGNFVGEFSKNVSPPKFS